ncbi:tautomerase family protein [Candidatus Igneacidithiobacillus taiwanensis]|uniref:tautomerase family protein n=1 Tax=Candidatus Igneacidithiobacillus taiwanensis TaxID=1945924 RepID=UPI0028A1189A|nr:tautomerase family protein [Candidatus Igneacidithiobacillus taiwanensis]
MAQIKIYGIRESLLPIRQDLSDTIHACVVEALQYPVEKRFHRFILMDREDMIFPKDRSEQYTIIEIAMMEGRSIEAKKKLIRLLFDRIHDSLGIPKNDIEVCIQESPPSNWGFRGATGDEISLNYPVKI